MPFRSESQRRFLWAKFPKIAKKWTKKYGSEIEPSKSKSTFRAFMKRGNHGK